MSALKKMRRTIVADTPEVSRHDYTIVEDSVFDTSQVPDTAERTRQHGPSGGVPGTGGQTRTIKHGPRKLKNLPSFLPSEETFVTQSQQVALSSTVLDKTTSSSSTNSVHRKSNSSTKDRRKSSRRSNVTKEDLLSFVLSRKESPSKSSEETMNVNSSIAGIMPIPDSDSDDEDIEWDRLKSVHGSVQKYLPKANPDPRKSVLISGNVKSKTRACLSAPKAQQPRKVAKNLVDDLRRKSLVNDTIEEVTEEEPGTDTDNTHKSNLDPKLLVQSYQNFSTDSAKALIAQMEKGDYHSDKSTGPSTRTSSQSSCDSTSSKTDEMSNPIKKGRFEKTSLTPVDMDVVTPAPVSKLSSLPSVASPSLRNSNKENGERVDDDSGKDDDLPATQTAPILSGVKVFVDVRIGQANVGKVLEKKAEELGAEVLSKLTGDATHVIFKDGSLVNYKRAKKFGSHIVSAKWLESSKEMGAKVPEAEYPSVSQDKYDSPGVFSSKLRKMKSMQPKTLEEDYAAASKSVDRKLKIQARKNQIEINKANSEQKGLKTKRPPHNHYYKGCEKFYNRSKSENNSLQELVNKLQNSPAPNSGTPMKLIPSGISPPVSPSSSEYDTPLADRLAKRYQSPLELRQRNRNHSTVSSLSSTPIKSSKDIVNSEQVKELTVNEIGKSSNENPTKSTIAKPNQKGRKRKVSDPRDEDGNTTDQQSTLVCTTDKRSPLKDLSNSTRNKPARNKHKLFAQKCTQILDETVDITQPEPARVDVIENVHITVKKKAATNSRVPKSRKNSVNTETSKHKEEMKKKENNSVKEASKKNVKTRKTNKDRRRTSFDFLPPKFSQSSSSSNSSGAQSSHLSSNSSQLMKGKVKPTGFLSVTSCSKEDKQLAKQLTKRFGLFGFHDAINEKTTHVICGESKRTLNLVKGMIRGCWIITKDWLLASLEEGRWVDEEPYELVQFSSAVRDFREERQVFGIDYRSQLFSDVGPVYISSKCRIARTDLRQVVTWGGGEVVNTARVAAVVVGEFCHVGDSSTPQFVTDTWILDTVQNNVLMPFLDYPL